MIQSGEPCSAHLMSISWAQNLQIRHSSQSRQLFDWLVSGAVLSKEDRIMGELIDHRHMRKRCEADSISHVITERQECTTIRKECTRERQAVADGSHSKFSHTVFDVAPIEMTGTYYPAMLQERFV